MKAFAADFSELQDVVVNAAKVQLTGKKLDQKMYRYHTGYVGGLKEITYREMMAKKPEEVISHAVSGMLCKNKLRSRMMTRLRVFAGPNHDHAAQNPEVLKGLNFVSAQPGVDITLSFDPNEMRVYGGVVNRYNGAYTADGDNIKFEGFASTMMMGAPDAMETETEYFQFMPTVETYEYSDGKLTLIGENGKEIVFVQVENTPTDANAE